MVSRADLLGKASAILQTLAGLARSQKTRPPPAHFANDLNRLRVLVLEAYPSVDERLIGPQIATAWKDDAEVSVADYASLEAYVRQIHNLLVAQPEVIGTVPDATGSQLADEGFGWYCSDG
jgi:hypothetical protein